MSCQDTPPTDKNKIPVRNNADTALLHDLTRWREQLARSIARNNLGMRSGQITTAVNRIIFSMMFLCIAEDRGFIQSGTLRNIRNTYSDTHALLPVLRHSRALYHNGPHTCHEARDEFVDLILEDHVLSGILCELTSADRRYNFAAIPTETLSQVFLRYLTKTVRRSAAHHAVVVDTHDTTQSVGTTIPPLPAAEYMAMSALAAVRENRSAREVLPIRVIDPACGAGVFLLYLYRYILENSHDGTPTFEECREILAGSIYGLDINRHAVAVTRMLLFFGLLENRHTGQFPHAFFTFSEQVFMDLRHTIQCGNALIGPEITDDESWMFCPPQKRHTLNMFNWRNGFPEIFATGGFDAVVSAPSEGFLEDREWIQQYFQRHYHVYHPLADRSVYLIEKGLSLLRTGGTLACFLNDAWLRGSGGAPLRMLLLTKQIEEIVDLSVTEKSNSGTVHCILRISNRSPSHPFYATLAGIRFLKNPVDFVRTHRFPVDQARLDDGGWTLADTRISNLLKKVNRHGIPLYEFVMGQVHAGIETGDEKLFVIDDRAKKNLIRKDPRCKHLIRRFVSGSHIDRYHMDRHGRSIVFIPRGWTTTHTAAAARPWQWFKKRYPFLAHHLKQAYGHHPGLKVPGYVWWEIAGDDDFWLGKNPKILFRHQFKKPAFTFDEGPSIGDPTVHAIASSSLYLLGLLNSRLLSFTFEKSVQKKPEEPRLFTWDDLRMLPIYAIDFDNPDDKARHDRMVALVTEMLKLHNHLTIAKTDQEKLAITLEIESTDRQINSLVYGLYGLNAEEISVAEESMKK